MGGIAGQGRCRMRRADSGVLVHQLEVRKISIWSPRFHSNPARDTVEIVHFFNITIEIAFGSLPGRKRTMIHFPGLEIPSAVEAENPVACAKMGGGACVFLTHW